LSPHNEALSKTHTLVGKSVTDFEVSNVQKPTVFRSAKKTRMAHRDVSRRRGNSVACGAKRPFRELRVPTGIDGSAPGSWRAAIPLVLAKPL